MNTTNFTPIESLKWDDVMARQKEIMLAYEPELEQKLQPGGFDINTLEDQELAKKFIGRIIEELCEAAEAHKALVSAPFDHPRERELAEHVVEEVVDAFNFFLELLILMDMPLDREHLISGLGQEITSFSWEDVVYSLGMASNKLKNRGWRSSQYLVDLLVLRGNILDVTKGFGKLFASMKICTASKVKKVWSLKYQVNLFRLETKY